MSSDLRLFLGPYLDSVNSAVDEARRSKTVERIWQHEANVWKDDDSQQAIIRNSLGWLTVAQEMKTVVSQLQDFALDVKASGFKQVTVCGMGGSSLCPEVLARTFGRQQGFPELLVLDSTDPDFIADLRKQIDLEHCLFLIASKSGTTTEPNVFYQYWFDQVSQKKPNAGESFVAITDPGTPLVTEAQKKSFRKIFLNQADIGGRYSALSYFGMVPAALMGLDLNRLFDSAMAMAQRCGPATSLDENPGVLLGAAMGECAKVGRDKLTLVTDERLATLGLWIEQLVAESTGKEGKGILPVNGEALTTPDKYHDDRLFICVTVGEPRSETSEKLKQLEAAGHPVIYRQISDLYDLGGEFFLWEFATAFAGWRIGINPFDQPNVQESKDATKKLLQIFTQEGKLPEQTAMGTDGPLSLYGGTAKNQNQPVVDILRALLKDAGSRDYVAFLAYVEETEAITQGLQALRTRVRDATGLATTVGYGPRFLHSTGQLHKGGPDTGIFFQLTASDVIDLDIPGEKFSFGVLKQAQALGDFQSLLAHGRRAVRVDLGKDVVAGLRELEILLVSALD